jgi:hypothetical protein
MKNPSNAAHLPLQKSQQRTSIKNIYMNRRQVFRTFSRYALNCILLAEHYIFQALLELHPAQPRVTLLPCFAAILLYFVLYLPLYTSLYIPNFTSSNMEPTASQVRNQYSQKNQEAHLERALARALQKTANLHCQSNV